MKASIKTGDIIEHLGTPHRVTSVHKTWKDAAGVAKGQKRKWIVRGRACIVIEPLKRESEIPDYFYQ